MQRGTSFLFLSLIVCAALSETFGLVFSVSTNFTVGDSIHWAASMSQLANNSKPCSDITLCLGMGVGQDAALKITLGSKQGSS